MRIFKLAIFSFWRRLVRLVFTVIYNQKVATQAAAAKAIQVSFDGTSLGKVADINVYIATMALDVGIFTKPMVAMPQVSHKMPFI